MSARKKRPEFELGPLLINQVQEYLGVRVVNKLTGRQAANIARLCNECASVIGVVLEDADKEIQLLGVDKRSQDL